MHMESFLVFRILNSDNVNWIMFTLLDYCIIVLYSVQ